MMAVPWERTRMFLSVSRFSFLLSPCMTAYSVAGMMSEADATAMSEDMVDATVSLKRLSCWVIPAARKQHPSTLLQSAMKKDEKQARDSTHQKNV